MDEISQGIDFKGRKNHSGGIKREKVIHSE